jgi:hypothetical protein
MVYSELYINRVRHKFILGEGVILNSIFNEFNLNKLIKPRNSDAFQLQDYIIITMLNSSA